jgi:site-specific DNA recombinase
MNKPAAIYARVSSDRQKENHTIASQTAALIEYAQTHGYSVPPEWVFQDEGYSGAILVRPGLEALRDLAAEGQITTVLVYSPDRLSRKYAYQVLLSEELLRCGVELIFLKAPAGATPEDQLLVQFQGMIAEYERAQIAERCRRGKKHMAQQGGVNVLSGAPYGYRYVRKSDTSAAFYEVVDTEAKVVRMVFEIYTQQRLSINAIARLLNDRQIATRTGKGRWERSTVWGMLRNPAYRGTACYGKTEQRPRQRITRPLRQRKALPSRDVGGHERPRRDWIEVPVPALVSEEMFALAQEQLEKNRNHSPRRTIEPTLLQGVLVCEQCGYGLYRASTRTSKHKLHYYRCIGSDGYRRLNGPLCTNRPIRQDYLDQFVWQEIIRLLDDPGLIQAEIDRRRDAARNADPLRKREEELRREQARVEKSSERLVTAYQEGLVTLPQLRQRMPALQKTDAGRRIGITISEDGGDGRGEIPATGGESRGLSQQVAITSRRVGHGSPPADPPAGCKGGPGRHRHGHRSAFYSDSTIGTRIKRTASAVRWCHRIKTRHQVIFCVRGVLSPTLANLYLHHVLDLWVEVWRKKQARGDVMMVRYADDAVLGFQYREEAEQFLEQLRERLAKFGLERHPEKTRLIELGRYAMERRKKRGEGKPETFNFLGFTHLCGTNHQTGNFTVNRKTIGKRMAAKLKDIRAKLRQRMHARIPGTTKWLQQVVRGYFQYHAVPGNWERMKRISPGCVAHLVSSLTRRSQRSRLNWERFRSRLGDLLPPVQIPQPYPDERFDGKHPNIRGRNRVR